MTLLEYAEIEIPILKSREFSRDPQMAKIILKKNNTEDSHALISKFPTKL